MSIQKPFLYFIPGIIAWLIRPVFLIMLILPLLAEGQIIKEDTIRSLTIEDAVSLALDNNIEIKNTALERKKTEYNKGSSIQIKPIRAEYRRGQINSYLNDQWLEVYQNFGSPLESYYNRKKAEHEINAKEKELKLTKLEIEKETKLVYFNWIYLYNKKKIIQQQLEKYKELARVVDIREKMGESDRLSKFMAQSQFHKAKTELKKIRNQTSIAENQLKLLLNTRHHLIPKSDTLRLYEIRQPQPQTNDLVNPTLQDLYEEKININNYEIKAQKARYLPEITAGYFRQEINQTGGFNGWMLGISVPLWYQSKKAAVQKAKVNKAIAENNLVHKKNKQQTTVKNLVHELNSYKEDIIYFHESALNEFEELLSIAQEQYEKEEITYDNYIDLLKKAYEIKTQYLETVKNYNQTAVKLEFYVN